MVVLNILRNFLNSLDLLDKLSKKLERAQKLGKEMNELIDKLIRELKNREKEIPKFNDNNMIEQFEIIDNYC